MGMKGNSATMMVLLLFLIALGAILAYAIDEALVQYYFAVVFYGIIGVGVFSVITGRKQNQSK